MNLDELVKRLNIAEVPIAVYFDIEGPYGGKYRIGVAHAKHFELMMRKHPSQVLGVYDSRVKLDDLLDDIHFCRRFYGERPALKLAA